VYVVEVQDANGCLAVDSVELLGPPPFDVDFVITNTKCHNTTDGALQVSASNGPLPFTYEWQTSPVVAGQTLANVAPGTYVVEITDGNGCIQLDSATVGSPTPLATALSTTNVTCHGGSNGSVTVFISGATPPYNILWSNPPAITNTISNLPTGGYFVRVNDANGCIVYDTTFVSEPDTIQLVSLNLVNETCFGSRDGRIETQFVGGTGTLTYAWSTSPVVTNDTLLNIGAGNYTLTVRDSNLCVWDSLFVVNSPAPFDIQTGFIEPTCFGFSNGLVFANASGSVPADSGYTFAWQTSPVVINDTLFNASSTIYTLVVSDSIGCTDTVTVAVTEPTQLNAQAFAEPVSCEATSGDGKVFAQATGGTPGYTFQWTGPAGYSATGPAQFYLDAGPYIVTITDARGCVDIANTVVTVPAPLTPVVTTFPASCHDSWDGSAYVTTTGGTPPYNYVWVTYPVQQYTDTVTGLRQGTTLLKVFDNVGCRVDVPFVITAPDTLRLALEGLTNPYCPGEELTATATATGGTPNYTIVWNYATGGTLGTGNTLATASPADTTQLFATVTDANGCTTTDSSRVFTFLNPRASFSISDSIGCDLVSAQFNNTSQQGVSFFWDFGDGNTSTQPEPVYTWTTGGTFDITLVATSREGCQDTAIRTAAVTVYPTATAGIAADPSWEQPIQLVDATIQFTPLGEFGTTFLWNFGDGTTSTLANPTHTYTQAGNYLVTLTVENALGCGESAQYGPMQIRIPEIQVPNVFTPNGDGANDVFQVRTLGISDDQSLTIFDRWGNQLYNGRQPVWDGRTSNGEQAVEGVYFYLYRAKAVDGREFESKGEVTLLR
jgi:gliding motility-associated-like protein